MTITLLDENNQPVEVPEEHLADAWQSGKYAAPGGADQQFTIKRQGKLFSVPASKLSESLSTGATPASQEDLDKHAADKAAAAHSEKYGGVGGELAAAGGGALDTATFGLGNYALPQAAKDYVREAEQENPTAKLVGQGAGIAVPLAADVLTGGAATPELAAGEAGVLGGEGAGLLGQGARLAGKAVAAPGRALGAAGDLTGNLVERGLQKIVGGDATSLAGKLATKGAVGTAKGATEGALMGVAQTAGDEALQEDPNLTAEKLMHGGLLGAVMGGVGGGVLGIGGELGSRFAGPLSKTLDHASDEQATRALMPSSDKRGMREILKQVADEDGVQVEGTDAMGGYLKKKGLIAVGDDVNALAPKIAQNAQEEGARVGGIRQEADNAGFEGPNVQSIYDSIQDKLVSKLKKVKSLDGGATKRVEALMDDLSEMAHVPEGEAAFAPIKKIPETVEEIQGFRKTLAGKQAWEKFTNAADEPTVKSAERLLRVGQLPDSILPFIEHSGETLASKAKLSFQDAAEFRARIDKAINYEKGPDGQYNAIGEALKDVRGTIEREIEQKIKAGDESLGERYMAAKSDYAKAVTANKIVQRGVATKAANRFFSPTDYGAGAAIGSIMGHAATGGAAGVIGGLPGIAMGVAGGVAHHYLRERGNATAAVILDKLSSIHALQRISQQGDRALTRIVQGAVVGTDHPEYVHKVEHAKDYDGQVATVLQAASSPDELMGKIQDAVGGIAGNHPGVASAFTNKSVQALSWLAQQIPPTEHPNPNSLTPQLDKNETSDEAKDAFMRKFQGVMNPMGSIAKIKDGTITADERDAIVATHPELYQKTCDELKASLAQAKKPVPYEVESSIRMFMKLPAVTPALAGVLQDYELPRAAPATGSGKKGAGTGGTKTKMTKKVDFGKNMKLQA